MIAEVKKASPSRGVIRADFDPAAIARSYEAGGVACPVGAHRRRFLPGRGWYLVAAREACSLPVLRKDFVVDATSCTRARALGADAVLLIAAALDDAQLADFAALAAELGLDVLAEVHDADELERVLRPPSVGGQVPLVGVNNRDLRTFEVSLDTTLALKDAIPAGRTLVTESGILAPADVARMHKTGVHAFLVGEAFMREPDRARPCTGCSTPA